MAGWSRMVSLVLEVGRLFVGLGVPALSLSSSISPAQFCLHGGLRVLNTAKEDKVQYTSSCKGSAWVMFANVSLGKASHWPTPDSRYEEIELTSWWEELQNGMLKVWEDYVAILQLKEKSRRKGRKEGEMKGGKWEISKCGIMLITVEFGGWDRVYSPAYFVYFGRLLKYRS